MARQAGLLQFKGKLGNLSFYKDKEGFHVRTKGGVPGDRLKTDPQFERTRENWAEFGRAGAASKLVRQALRVSLHHIKDRTKSNRLTREFMRIVKADGVHGRGQRMVLVEHTPKLEKFEFNSNGGLATTFKESYTATIDRVTGALSVEIPAFVPQNSIVAPAGTTHVRLISNGLEVDFESGQYVVTDAQSGYIVWGPQTQGVITLAHALPPNSTKSLMLTLGVEFYQDVNGDWYPLKDGTFNALALVSVNGTV